ncbi:MAG: hypothetical protein IID09_08920 [Candidatus Hydrogenedentes bacterium]|nr:hypothetical protein [Candidatus Hydrogenedentota bacterium]
MKVISRSSAMRYKGTDKPLSQIAQELGVEAIVEGSVFRAGDDVRITAQLIHVATDSHLLSENYTGTLENIFKLQGEVAMAIAEAIRVTVTPEEETRIASAKPVDPEAYDLYLRGLQASYGSLQGVTRSVTLFDQALAIAPDFALAWVKKSLGHAVVASLVPQAYELQSKLANEAADKAIALAPDESEAYYARFFMRYSSLDWYGAKETADFAFALNPNLAVTNLALGMLEVTRGDSVAAQKHLERAYELDPHSPHIALFAGFYFAAAFNPGRGLQILDQLIAEQPDSLGTHFIRALCLLQLERSDDALAAFEQSAGRMGSLGNLIRAYGYAQQGRMDEAREIESLIVNASPSVVPPEFLAIYYVLAGDIGQALTHFEKAMEKPSVNVVNSLRSIPFGMPSSVLNIAEITTDDRYWQLIDRMNLPPFPLGHPGYEAQQKWEIKKSEARP